MASQHVAAGEVGGSWEERLRPEHGVESSGKRSAFSPPGSPRRSATVGGCGHKGMLAGAERRRFASMYQPSSLVIGTEHCATPAACHPTCDWCSGSAGRPSRWTMRPPSLGVRATIASCKPTGRKKTDRSCTNCAKLARWSGDRIWKRERTQPDSSVGLMTETDQRPGFAPD